MGTHVSNHVELKLLYLVGRIRDRLHRLIPFIFSEINNLCTGSSVRMIEYIYYNWFCKQVFKTIEVVYSAQTTNHETFYMQAADV